MSGSPESPLIAATAIMHGAGSTSTGCYDQPHDGLAAIIATQADVSSGSDGAPRRRIVLAGAGGFVEEVTELANVCGFEVAAWIEGVDPHRSRQAGEPPILWVDEQAAFEPDLPVAPAIGSVHRRALMERLVSEGRSLVSIIHPSVLVAPSAVIEDGCVIVPGVIIRTRARIGTGTIVGSGALIGHHVVIGPHNFISQGASIAGMSVTGPQVTIALGAIVRDHVTVGAGATIGAGAVAVKDVPPAITVIGVPARPMERPRDA